MDSTVGECHHRATGEVPGMRIVRSQWEPLVCYIILRLLPLPPLLPMVLTVQPVQTGRGMTQAQPEVARLSNRKR